MFSVGQTYRRAALHAEHGGQRQGGISTPKGKPFVFLFTGESGKDYGYRDGWHTGDIYYYTGEGQRGDMQLTGGNKAISEHISTRKDLYLFEQAQRSHVRFLGQFVCVGHHTRRSPDGAGNERDAIVFELSPLSELTLEESLGEPLSGPILERADASLAQLRVRALADSADSREPIDRKASIRRRSEAIRRYVLARAGGICEGCKRPAPFRTPSGEPYLEPHHINRLSDGGPDHPKWVAAVCANCHRRAHFSVDATAFNKELTRRVQALES